MRTFLDFGIDLPAAAQGEVATVCPQCSESRRKRRARCLKVNTDEGVWYCHHCHWSGSLRARRERTPATGPSRAQLLRAAHVLILAADDAETDRDLEWSPTDRETIRRSFNLIANNPPRPYPIPAGRIHRIEPDPLVQMRGLIADALEEVRHAI